MYLSRAKLRTDTPISAIAPVLLPSAEDARISTSHRLLWTLFGDTAGRTRDFLWRENDGQFFVLSEREPVDGHNLFRLATKPFRPQFKPEQRVGFVLRVNATMSIKEHRGAREGKRCDVVTLAVARLRAENPAATREEKDEAVSEALFSWLSRQGEASGGFALLREAFSVEAQNFVGIERGRGKKNLSFGVADVCGTLTVTDPEVFATKIAAGFGRSRAFGCGLMMVRALS